MGATIATVEADDRDEYALEPLAVLAAMWKMAERHSAKPDERIAAEPDSAKRYRRRMLKVTALTNPFSSASRTSSAPSRGFMANGFSHTTCFPASSAALACS